MRIRYSGTRENKQFWKKNTPCFAEIMYNDRDNVDCQVMEYVIKVLEVNGWEVPGWCENIISIQVLDRGDYDSLVAFYKDAKKSAKMFAKFFPKKSSYYVPDSESIY